MDRITISVSNDMGEDLREIAKKNGESVSRIVSNAIAQYMDLMRRKKLGGKVLEIIKDSDMPAEALREIDAWRDDGDSRI